MNPSNWTDPKIVDDPRINHEDPVVRAAAEDLHHNESLHLHLDIGRDVCVYCALRASRVVDVCRRYENDQAREALAALIASVKHLAERLLHLCDEGRP